VRGAVTDLVAAGRHGQAQATDLLLEPRAAEQRPRRDAARDVGRDASQIAPLVIGGDDPPLLLK